MKIVALVAAVLCFAVAALYASGHFPGSGHAHHIKHAVALALLGALALVWMRMQNSQTQTA